MGRKFPHSPVDSGGTPAGENKMELSPSHWIPVVQSRIQCSVFSNTTYVMSFVQFWSLDAPPSARCSLKSKKQILSTQLRRAHGI